jgi:hypothetical protein
MRVTVVPRSARSLLSSAEHVLFDVPPFGEAKQIVGMCWVFSGWATLIDDSYQLDKRHTLASYHISDS